jgi:hypothetical protein
MVLPENHQLVGKRDLETSDASLSARKTPSGFALRVRTWALIVWRYQPKVVCLIAGKRDHDTCG